MIQIQNLVKRYGNVVAVDGLSFTARPARVTALLGRNGAGKTTTMRVLLGLTRPTAGSATIDGRPYAKLNRPLTAVGAVVEEPTYHPARSGRSHLQILACAAALAPRRVEEVLELVELTDAASRRVGTYSLGMRQRLGLAAGLLGDPATLVLDEPQNGLDPQGIAWLRGLLRRLADEGRTVLVSSHQLAEVSELADAVVILSRGRLVRAAPLAELLHDRDEVRVVADEPDRLAAALAAAGMPVKRRNDGQLLVQGHPAPEIGALAAAHGIGLHELATQRRSLEDVFLELTDDVLQEAR